MPLKFARSTLRSSLVAFSPPPPAQAQTGRPNNNKLKMTIRNRFNSFTSLRFISFMVNVAVSIMVILAALNLAPASLIFLFDNSIGNARAKGRGKIGLG